MNKLLTLLAAAAFAAADGTRPPALAGHFYPAKAKDLAALVDAQLAQAPVEVLPAGASVVALLVPHAGLEFSGSTAARAYKLLKKGDFDAVIVVGTCHYKELEGAALYPGAYGTPDGFLPYASDLAKALMKASPLIKENAAAHKKEQSIEVEIPYLRRALGRVPLVALIMNTQDLESSRRIGEAIAKVVKGRRVLLVASSDQSHFPSGGIADAVDRTTLAALQTLEPAYFWLTNRYLMNRSLPHLSVTYCGEGAVIAVMTAARELGANRARVLAHLNSGDVVSERDYNHVVGYAAAAFTREPGAAPSRPSLSTKEKRALIINAHAAVEAAVAVAGGGAAAPLSADALLNLPAAVFVTLRGPDGKQRGRAGALEPQESLLEAVVHDAEAAAREKHAPVTAAEAPGLKAEIAVLSPARTVSAEAVKPGDGVAVEQDGRQGVFLPEAWKELPKKDDFLGELCAKKAGLPRDCWKSASATLKVFSVDRFGE
jgi:AmmeMemoRadiSam system protein B/AmmeMemoRadiSam system protein A